MEEAVVITNRAGRRLFGILHRPDGASGGGVGVNLLNPGLKYRVAPHRMSVKLARELCRRGFQVLRLDPEGVGDSEGELPQEIPVPDAWGRIQKGLFVEDALAGNDFLTGECGLGKLVMMGNCGGAITALLAGARDERVGGLCLVDVPVYLLGASSTFAVTAAQGGQRLDRLFGEYLKRALRPSSWWRLLTMQSDLRSLARIVGLKLKKAAGRGPQTASPNLDEFCRSRGLNPLFFTAFDRVASRPVPVLFVLAGKDPGLETFESAFVGGRLRGMAAAGRVKAAVEIHKVDGANHIYTLAEWQGALSGRVMDWMDRWR